MKCTGISVGNEHPRDNRTFDQFIGSDHASDNLGELLIALTKEATWTRKYNVYASFGEKSYLRISHPSFPHDRPLMVQDDGTIPVTVRGVEEAVRSHIGSIQEGLRPAINLVQSMVNDLTNTKDQIMWDKAMAAVVAVFPEAQDAERQYAGSIDDLYPFGVDGRNGPLYVARLIGSDFVGGVARVSCSVFEWYQLKDGIRRGERHGIFWGSLALVFAAHELGIPQEDLWFADISASEMPWEATLNESYVVEKVILRSMSQEVKIVVEFGSDNLPVTATADSPQTPYIEKNALYL